MLGRQQLVIDASEFLKGMSSGPEISDGGFSSQTEAVNLAVQPGVVYAPAAAADADTDDRLSTTIEIIASSPDMANLGVDNRLLVGANASDDGTFYRYDGTKIIAAAYATDVTRNYIKGYTDIITYRGEAYVTSQSTIVRWQNDNTINQTFFTFATGNVLHPAIVFEDNAYHGDNNLLLRQTAAGGTPTTILTLAVGEIIIALGVDPNSGKILISTTSSLNVSNAATSINKLHWYDGFSNKTLKTIYVEDMIVGFHSNGGVVYCGYGQNVGLVTGSGIRFLRKLLNVTLNNEQLPYKHNMTSVGNTFYVADGNQILAYGPVRAGGSPIWYYCVRNKDNDNVFQSIFSAGSNKIGFSHIGVFKTVDLSSIATIDKLDFRTNWIYFPRPVHIRSIFIEENGTIGNINNRVVSYYDQTSTAVIQVLTTTKLSDQTFEAIGFTNKLTNLKLRFEFGAENDGLKRVIIYYDYAE